MLTIINITTNDSDHKAATQKGKRMRSGLAVVASALVLCASGAAWAADIDEGAAEALMKKSNCGKCHSVDKKKEGPPYKETAGKYKGKADGEDKLFKHLTTNPKVKVEGKEEEHTSLKTKKDDDVKNVVRWILTR